MRAVGSENAECQKDAHPAREKASGKSSAPWVNPLNSAQTLRFAPLYLLRRKCGLCYFKSCARIWF